MYTSTNYLLYKYVGNVVCPFKVIFCGIFGVHFKGLWLSGRVVPTPSTEMLKDDGVNWSLWTFFPCTSWMFCTWIVLASFPEKKWKEKSCELEGEFPGVHRKNSLEGWKLLRFLSFVCMHSYKHSRSFLSFGSEEFKKVVPCRLPSYAKAEQTGWQGSLRGEGEV